MPVIKTRACLVCGKTEEVEVTEQELKAYQSGGQIQKTLPRLTPSERELIISGTHSECFDILFPPEDDD